MAGKEVKSLKLAIILILIISTLVISPDSVNAGYRLDELGGVDLDGYCQSKGWDEAALTENTAYGWVCRKSNGETTGIDMYDVCDWQYGNSPTPEYGSFNDPYSWVCVGSDDSEDSSGSNSGSNQTNPPSDSGDDSSNQNNSGSTEQPNQSDSNNQDTDSQGENSTSSNIGGLDLNAYCSAIGWGHAELVSNNAYGWVCKKGTGQTTGLDLYKVCHWQYGNHPTPIYSNYNDPYSWTCSNSQGNSDNDPDNQDPGSTENNQGLGQQPSNPSDDGPGGVDLNSYCRSIGWGQAKLVSNNAYGWVCRRSNGQTTSIDMFAVCGAQYEGYPTPQFQDFDNPYSWVCTEGSSSSDNPSSPQNEPQVPWSSGNYSGNSNCTVEFFTTSPASPVGPGVDILMHGKGSCPGGVRAVKFTVDNDSKAEIALPEQTEYFRTNEYGVGTHIICFWVAGGSIGDWDAGARSCKQFQITSSGTTEENTESDPPSGGSSSNACVNWTVGSRVGMKSGSEIRTGSGLNYPVHTVVPTNNWQVDIIDGPRSADGHQWWDISRSNIDGGGTGWVYIEQAGSNVCSSNSGGGTPNSIDEGNSSSEPPSSPLDTNPAGETPASDSPGNICKVHPSEVGYYGLEYEDRTFSIGIFEFTIPIPKGVRYQIYLKLSYDPEPVTWSFKGSEVGNGVVGAEGPDNTRSGYWQYGLDTSWALTHLGWGDESNWEMEFPSEGHCP